MNVSNYAKTLQPKYELTRLCDAYAKNTLTATYRVT